MRTFGPPAGEIAFLRASLQHTFYMEFNNDMRYNIRDKFPRFKGVREVLCDIFIL